MAFQDPSIRIPTYQVDAFTHEPLRGNPAAVCILDQWYPDDLLQRIAAEMNLSETAFINRDDLDQPVEPKRIQLRWFTPEVEVPLCGHATLATSAVLFWELGYPYDEIVYDTMSGELVARKQGQLIQLDLPADDPAPVEPSLDLITAMGIKEYKDVMYATRGKDLLVRVGSWQEVRDLKPDFSAMRAASTQIEVTGVVVTSTGTPGNDFVSRFFAPWLGIDEDPVTGAAHTILGPYWSRMLGKKRMAAVQISKRQGDLIVEVTDGGRVYLTGDAALVLVGEIRI